MNKSIRSIAMREKMRTILGVLNILLSVFMLLFYLYWVLLFYRWFGNEIPSLRLEYAMIWFPPYIVAAVLALVSGILTLKGKRLLWAIVGPLFSGAALAYWFLLMWLLPRLA